MVSRIRAVPTHVRLSWLLPLLAVLTALALAVTSPDEPRALLARLALVDAALSSALIVFLFTPAAGRGWRSTLGTVLRGAALAGLAFPEVRSFLWLDLLGFAVGGVLLVRGLRTPLPEGYAELDDLERLYAFCGRLGHRSLRLPLYDLWLLRHLLARPRLPVGDHFGTRRGATTGATFTLLVFGSAVEGLLAHVLLERWSVTAAWVWTGLSALGLLWLLAYGRALATRPVTVGPRRLYLRSGLHWTGSTPLVNLQEVAPHDPEGDRDALSIAIDVRPNVTLTFGQPVRLHGLYLTEREVRRVALHVDDPAAFRAALGR